MRTVEQVLKDASNKGLMLANLFELRTHPASLHTPSRGTGEYQANFHHANGWHDFGRGKNPVEALEDALSRAKGLQGPENRPIPREAPILRETPVKTPVKAHLALESVIFPPTLDSII